MKQLLDPGQRQGQNQKLTSRNPSGTLKEQLQQAWWLINSMEKRHRTILSVAKKSLKDSRISFTLVREMRPLRLNNIAGPLGIHESTVSRATTGKYLSAPQGNFALKYFFQCTNNRSGRRRDFRHSRPGRD